LEGWKAGRMGYVKYELRLILLKPIIPMFHYSMGEEKIDNSQKQP
jgi:hypothetical protein